MKVDSRSARDAQLTPGAVTTRGPNAQARPPGPASRQNVMKLVGLATVARLPWDRRFQVQVITLAIALAAAARIAREGQTTSFARISAWDKQRNLRALLKPKAALKASGTPKGRVNKAG